MPAPSNTRPSASNVLSIIDGTPLPGNIEEPNVMMQVANFAHDYELRGDGIRELPEALIVQGPQGRTYAIAVRTTRADGSFCIRRFSANSDGRDRLVGEVHVEEFDDEQEPAMPEID